MNLSIIMDFVFMDHAMPGFDLIKSVYFVLSVWVQTPAMDPDYDLGIFLKKLSHYLLQSN